MKTLTKLALVSAMAISANAMALETLDDESLSAATGQDGVTISLTGPITMDYLAIVDRDGLTPAGHGITTPATGAIVIGDATNGLTITPANGINLIIDADGNGGAPVLNINADLGTTVIDGVNISVATSDATGATIGTGTARVSALDLGSITLNNLTANIQLGSQPQGALITLQSNITGGLSISDLSLKQGANHGIGLGTVNVKDAGAANTDLTLDLDLNATNNGLEITGLTSMDISASNLRLGNLTGVGGTQNAALGAMYISNLNVGGSVAIRDRKSVV